MKRTPLRPVSAKRRRQNEVRRELLVRLRAERGETCQARTHVCTGVSLDGHEVVPRARGGDSTDEANILLVCRACHSWVHDHPEEATRRGLLASAPPRGES